MGMSKNVVGVRNMSVKFEKMLEIKKMCDKIEISYPVEVEDFFGGDVDEDEDYLRAEMLEEDLEGHECCKEFNNSYTEGYIIEIKKLPKEFEYIKFYDSW